MIKKSQDVKHITLLNKVNSLLNLYLYAQSKHPGLSPALTIDQLDSFVNKLQTSSINDEEFNKIEEMVDGNIRNVKAALTSNISP